MRPDATARTSHAGLARPSRQQGVILLMIVVVAVLAFISYIASRQSLVDIQLQRQDRTQQALQQAKQAIIAYAVNYPEIKTTATIRGPGYLLCPDTDNDGIAENSCNGSATVGRLPWLTLGLGDIRDGDNERLWYAVSENYDYTSSPANKRMNTATTGNITLRNSDGSILFDGASANALVAVVISPGTVLRRDDGVQQNRGPGNNAPVDYLDNVNGVEDNAGFSQNGQNGFITGPVLDANGQVLVNDRFATVRYDDIMAPVHQRVYAEVRQALAGYLAGCGQYPPATPFDAQQKLKAGDYRSKAGTFQGNLPVDAPEWATGGCAEGLLPDWFGKEEWHRQMYYHLAQDALAGGPCSTGCLSESASGQNNIDALIVFAGAPQSGQLRGQPASDLNDYFEGDNADTGPVYDAAEPDDFVGVVAP